MQAICRFGGCSCGCTEGETRRIISETREGLIYGTADTMNGYRVRHTNPYRKCDVEVIESDVTYNEIRAMAERLWVYDDKINQLRIEEDKSFYPPYTTNSEKDYPLSDEQLRINNSLKEKHLIRKEEIGNEIVEVNRQKLEFYRDHENIDANGDDFDFEE
jgi:hypothetical protein